MRLIPSVDAGRRFNQQWIPCILIFILFAPTTGQIFQPAVPEIQPTTSPASLASSFSSAPNLSVPPTVTAANATTDEILNVSTTASFPPTAPSSAPSLSATTSPAVSTSGMPTSFQPSGVSNAPASQHDTTTPPSSYVSVAPSLFPSDATGTPSSHFSDAPSLHDSTQPSVSPSQTPSFGTSYSPSLAPTLPAIFGRPSQFPISNQTSSSQTSSTAGNLTVSTTANSTADSSLSPSNFPTFQQTNPSSSPSFGPSSNPTSNPSSFPSSMPSTFPSQTPSMMPSYRHSADSYPSLRPSSFAPVTTVPSTSNSSSPAGSTYPSLSSAPASVPSAKPSSIPSLQLSFDPTNVPSLDHTELPSLRPTLESTTSNLPSMQPSSNPSRAGEKFGPETTVGLKMTMYGIDTVENEDSWAEDTALYIMNYYNGVRGEDDITVEWKGVRRNATFDVAVTITITQQIPNSTSKSEGNHIFTRRNLVGNYQGNIRQNKRREKEELAVEITYNQITTYKTSNSSIVDLNYVLEKPFLSKYSQSTYISHLQSRSSDYDSVTSISPVTIPDPPPSGVEEPETPPEDGKSTTFNWIPVVVGVAGGIGLVLLGVGGYLLYQKYRMREPPMERVGNGTPSMYSGIGNDDSVDEPNNVMNNFGSVGGDATVEKKDDRSAVSSITDAFSPINSQPPLPQFKSFAITPSSLSATDGSFPVKKIGTDGIIINVIAPPGRLGVIVDIPPGGGPPFICEFRIDSVLRHQLKLGDKIIAVDDEDVQKLTAISVSKLLASKSANPQRKITVLRDRDESVYL